MVIKKIMAAMLTLAITVILAACGKAQTTKTYEEYKWPDSEIASLLPVPESNVGDLIWERSSGFNLRVAETSKEQFDAYVEKCREAGFTVDYSRSDSYYYADNEEGYDLSLIYTESDQVMSITIKEPDDEEKTDEQEHEPEETKEQTEETATNEAEPEPEKTTTEDKEEAPSQGDIRPEFKDALDSYEAFMDEYIAFMEKYENSDDTLSLMTEYLDYLQKYADAMEKIGALEIDDMTEAESLYYAEVTLRVSTKLLESMN